MSAYSVPMLSNKPSAQAIPGVCLCASVCLCVRLFPLCMCTTVFECVLTSLSISLPTVDCLNGVCFCMFCICVWLIIRAWANASEMRCAANPDYICRTTLVGDEQVPLRFVLQALVVGASECGKFPVHPDACLYRPMLHVCMCM